MEVSKASSKALGQAPWGCSGGRGLPPLSGMLGPVLSSPPTHSQLCSGKYYLLPGPAHDLAELVCGVARQPVLTHTPPLWLSWILDVSSAWWWEAAAWPLPLQSPSGRRPGSVEGNCALSWGFWNIFRPGLFVFTPPSLPPLQKKASSSHWFLLDSVYCSLTSPDIL